MARSCCSYGEDNLSSFAQNCKPPHPPGDKSLWELQYCKFWGWNWVQKQNMSSEKMNYDISYEVPTKDVNYSSECFNQQMSKKLQKKHFKDLYECLCFKKRPKYVPDSKKLYATPSNSNTCICATDNLTNDGKGCAINCGIKEKSDSYESVKKMETQKMVSKKTVKKKSSEQSLIKICRDISDSDSCRCGYEHCRPSSTEDSVQYLKVICNCCKPEKLNKPKTDCQTQTCAMKRVVSIQKSIPQRICGTQTVPKRRKKRHVTVVCCHCCQCECTCRNGTNNGKNKSDEKFKRVISSECVCKPNPNYEKTTNTMNNCEGPTNRQFKDFKDLYEFKETTNKWKALDMYQPWNTIFTNGKFFQNFQTMPLIHPRIKNTKSDILDQNYRHKIDEEFASPVSGKVYKLSPYNIQSLKTEDAMSYPDPIEVTKDVEYLQNLEEKLKMDLNSRSMLDKICDSLLFNHKIESKESAKSMETGDNSTLLQTFTYPYEEKVNKRNVALLTDKSTLTSSSCLPKSFMSYDRCSKIAPFEQKDFFLENLLPSSGDFINTSSSKSPSVREEPFDFTNFSFSQSSSNYAKGYKRNASYANHVPVKRFKKTSETSKTDTINNMEALYRKMQEIIYIEKPKVLNKSIYQKKEMLKSKPTSKNLVDRSGGEYKRYLPHEKINNEKYTSERFHKMDDLFWSSENMEESLNNLSESSDTSLYSKIDEIINRTQATGKQIQQFVQSLPTKKSTGASRDYANVDLFQNYISTMAAEMSDGLTTILESSDERSENSFHRQKL